MTGSCVYRLYSKDGVLLYIGSTGNLTTRMDQHQRATIWRRWIAHIDSTPYPTLADARAAEISAIKSEHPRWNVIHRAANHPDGPAPTLAHLVALFPDGIERPHHAGQFPALAFDALIAPVLAGQQAGCNYDERSRRWAAARDAVGAA